MFLMCVKPLAFIGVMLFNYIEHLVLEPIGKSRVRNN